MRRIILMGWVMALAACSSNTTTTAPGPGSDPTPAQILGLGDSGQTMNLSVGDVVSVILDSNPSTGYGWQPTIPENLILLSQTFRLTEFEGSAQMVGVGGTDAFSFQVVSEGEGTLLMLYAPPGGQSAAIDRFELLVVADS